MKILLIISCLLIFTAHGAGEPCHEPQAHCQALELYQQATKMWQQSKRQRGNGKNSWHNAAQSAQQAIDLVATDKRLPFTVLCLSLQNDAYISEVIFVPCKRSAPYKANALLTEIKQQHPPKPYVFVSFKSPTDIAENALSGWQVNQQAAETLAVSSFTIGNSGQTPLSKISLSIKDGQNPFITSQTTMLKPQQKWTQQIDNQNLSRQFTLQLREKDQFNITTSTHQ